MTDTPLQQLRALLEKHCVTLQGQMAEFETAYRRAGPDETAMAILHSLKGNSGTMGFADIHERVTALESLLRDNGVPRDRVAAEADARIDAIRTAIAGARPEQSHHYNLKF